MTAIVKIGVKSILLVLSMGAARAQALTNDFIDDFESYPSQAAFAATWNADGAPPHTLDTAFGRNSSHSVRLVPEASGSGTTNRWYRNLTQPILPTDVNPVVFSFDFYLDAAGIASNWSADWQLVDVRAFSGGGFGLGSLNGIVALGVARSSSLNADSYNGAYFQSRVFAPGHMSQTYYSLNALPTAVPRSSGWHKLAARIGATQTLFSIDGLPAEQVNVGLTTPISSLILGSDISNAHSFWVDNVRLQQVPEPGSTCLLALATYASLLRRSR